MSRTLKALALIVSLAIGSAGAYFKYAEPKREVLYPEPTSVASMPEAIDATIFLLCKEKKSGKPMASASGARMYSPRDGKWLIATAAHVTDGCKRTEQVRASLRMTPDGEGFELVIERVVLEGNLFAVYKGKEHPVKTVFSNKYEDLAAVMTTDKIPGAYPWFDIKKETPDFQEYILTLGYPGPYTNPPQIMTTSGHINNPVVLLAGEDEDGKEVRMIAIVHDALVWFGNSGGPAVDSNWKLMGLNVAIESQSKQRFFTSPVGYLRRHLKEMKYHEEIYS